MSAHDGDDEKKVHLDEVLEKLGAFGRHQAVTMCMLALVYATNSMYNVNYVFAVDDVGYRCVLLETKQCDISILVIKMFNLFECH